LHTFAFKVREDCERCNIGWVHFGHKKEEWWWLLFFYSHIARVVVSGFAVRRSAQKTTPIVCTTSSSFRGYTRSKLSLVLVP
jgi:hypothetical protein